VCVLERGGERGRERERERERESIFYNLIHLYLGNNLL